MGAAALAQIERGQPPATEGRQGARDRAVIATVVDGDPDFGQRQQGATAHRLGERVMAAAHTLHYGVGVPVRKVPAVLHALTGDSHAAGPASPGHVEVGWWDGTIGPGCPIDTSGRPVVWLAVAADAKLGAVS